MSAEVPVWPAAAPGVDFVDLGASTGGSLGYCERRFGGRGIGIDRDPAKVAAAREQGANVVLGDATRLGISKRVRYVSAIDFLEHLPDLATAEAALASAAAAATDFLFISHPSFEGEQQLAALGLFQYWHRWSGHTNHMRVADLCQVLDRLGLHQYAIRYRERIDRTSHPSILPMAAGRNQHEYDRAVHGPKPEVALDPPVWRAQHVFVALRAFEPSAWGAITGEP